MKTKIITLMALLIFVAVNVQALDRSALKGFKKQKSKNGDVTIIKYKSKKLPVKNYYPGSGMHDYDNTIFFIYIGERNKTDMFLRMHVQLEPEADWIKFNKIIITFDGQTFEREFSKERLNSIVAKGAQFLEFYDEEVMPHEIDLFEKVGNAKEVTIKYVGENASQETKLKEKHVAAIAETVAAWKKLNS